MRKRGADLQRQAFRLDAGHDEVEEDVPWTVPVRMRVSPVTVRPPTRGGSASGMPGSAESRGMSGGLEKVMPWRP